MYNFQLLKSPIGLGSSFTYIICNYSSFRLFCNKLIFVKTTPFSESTSLTNQFTKLRIHERWTRRPKRMTNSPMRRFRVSKSLNFHFLLTVLNTKTTQFYFNIIIIPSDLGYWEDGWDRWVLNEKNSHLQLKKIIVRSDASMRLKCVKQAVMKLENE